MNDCQIAMNILSLQCWIRKKQFQPGRFMGRRWNLECDIERDQKLTFALLALPGTKRFSTSHRCPKKSVVIFGISIVYSIRKTVSRTNQLTCLPFRVSTSCCRRWVRSFDIELSGKAREQFKPFHDKWFARDEICSLNRLTTLKHVRRSFLRKESFCNREWASGSLNITR